tara:strand:- start:644 stop:892 length:249 start_codon:yes stop_codon:yes gene_type:complete
MKRWFTYIVQCSDGTLYTGITTCLSRRIEEHNRKKTGAKYTRSRRPVILVYSEEHMTRSDASKAEHRIKAKTRKEKLKIINS